MALVEKRAQGLPAGERATLTGLCAEYEIEDEVVEAFEMKYSTLSAGNFIRFAPYCAAKAERRTPISPAGKRKAPSAVTPDTAVKKLKGGVIWSPGVAQSPEKSPAPSSGVVKVLLNPALPKAPKNSVADRVELAVLTSADAPYRSVASPAAMADALNARCERMEKRIEASGALAKGLASLGAEPVGPSPVGEVSTELCAVTGRVCVEVEFSDQRTKLNEQSLLLEGSRLTSNGARVELRTSACPEVAIVPGQVIGAIGRTDASGRVFHAEKLIAGAPVPPARTRATGPVSVIVAAGPFTPGDDLLFQPLNRIIELVDQERPHLVILLGPLLDSSNKHIASGNLRIAKGDTAGPSEAVSFEDVYDSLVPRLRKLAALGTEVCILPSLSEIGVPCPALPQPKLGVRTAEWAKFVQMPNVHLASNPCTLEVAGLRMAITSQDPLLPLLNDMLNIDRNGPAPTSVDAALGLLLQQRSFFPAHPVPRGNLLHCAPTKLADLEFEELPDVCIFFSKLQHFAKCLGGRVFVNPGPAARESSFGSVAAMHIHPDKDLAQGVRVDLVKL